MAFKLIKIKNLIYVLVFFATACGYEEGSDPTSKSKAINWHLFGHNGINIKPAWEITQGNTNIRIAVVDNGFLPDSPAFSSCPERFEIFDFVKGMRQPNNHGANVTSLISTCAGNSLGLVSINPVSPLMLLERGNESSLIAQALFDWASGLSDCADKRFIDCDTKNTNPAHVINASFGGPPSGGPTKIMRSRLNYLNQIEAINKKGIILVAASGNDAKSADISFPNSLSGVISVGATKIDGNAASFSNWGETVEIMAPGQSVPAASKKGAIKVSGTSFAAPIVTGVVSLMKSVYQDLNWKTATYFMQSTATPMDCAQYCLGKGACETDCCKSGKQVCTPGRLNAGAAVAAAKNGLPDVALIDSDQYILELSPLAGAPPKKSGSFTLKNVGGKAGDYRLESDNNDLVFSQTNIRLEKKGSTGDQVTINISTTNLNPGESRLRIASPSSGVSPGFSDEIVIYIHQ